MVTPQQEAILRGGCFIGTLLLVAVWELLAPRRPLTQSKPLRWFSNLGLAVLNSVVWRLPIPAGAIGLALGVQARGWGLFNCVTLPEWFEVVTSVVLFDLAVYAQHWVFHRIPWLWRLHLVHHVDLDFDATTGIRFHTIETLLSFAWKGVVIVLLGPATLAVMTFEILLNATALFNHGNVRLPLSLDRVLRWVLVTPDMHRVHHSVEDCETNSNFGFCLPWWDFMFRTYRAQPAAGHAELVVGRREYRTADTARLWFLLCLPFRRRLPLSPCHQPKSSALNTEAQPRD